MGLALLDRLRDERLHPRRTFVAHVQTALPLLIASGLLVNVNVLLLTTGAADRVIISNAVGITGRFIGALLLVGYSLQALDSRLRWIAAGLAVSALGNFIVTCLPTLGLTHSFLPSLLNWTLFRIIASLLILRGAIPPGVALRSLVPTFASGAALFLIGSLLAMLRMSTLPPGSVLVSLGTTMPVATVPLWYWAIVTLPAAIGLLGVALIIRYPFATELGSWLPTGIVLLSVAVIYDLTWPSLGSETFDGADFLRLATSVVLVVGGVWDLQRLVRVRGEQLATERENARHLAALAEIKARFLGMVAHELASPLGAIRGLADMLESPTLTPEQRRATLASLQAETDILTVLVNDVQVAARLERDEFLINPRTVPIARLLTEAEQFARTLPGNHPVAVVEPTEADVHADPERIGQVLRNILNNAAKYSPAGTPITMRSRVEGGRVHIEVADQGFGIGADELTRIFEEFGRGQQALAATIPGLGLGLYLSHRIVRAHGGDIRVDSTPGVGSVFGFSLEVVR